MAKNIPVILLAEAYKYCIPKQYIKYIVCYTLITLMYESCATILLLSTLLFSEKLY